MSFVVLPSFEVEAEHLDAFLEEARADATQSLATEPGCRQFDVIVDRQATPIRVLFYEVYDDRAAFERHLQTPHLARFRASLHLCRPGPVQHLERILP
ncbi:Quinol monooxygenase YgiN [Paracoccus isoporae]|uniref:Quinol monooxygenase YgiN n=1 Tax=Paracoccus isoporae TaxID=591205 RepID=A0A1G7DLR0_9RHOB|nr:putative quinol monooxygenase [Paracoccus isoporae]SDE52056.1 Quinol monooxygenase YgiN [Paracoccus isoporae]